LLLIFFFRLASQFNECTDNVDEVSEGHAAYDLNNRNEKSFVVVCNIITVTFGCNFAKSNSRKNGGSPIPADDVLIKIGIEFDAVIRNPSGFNIAACLDYGQDV
jgi:hypothetical protein